VSRYRISADAKRDLRDIKAYLVVEAGTKVSRNVLIGLRAAMDLLARMPGIGHARHDLTDENVRFWSVYSHLVVYEHEVRPIRIVRVLHGARDLESLFARIPTRFRP
jgi:toxin ParE1/3/4